MISKIDLKGEEVIRYGKHGEKMGRLWFLYLSHALSYSLSLSSDPPTKILYLEKLKSKPYIVEGFKFSAELSRQFKW